ncbi:replication protein RepA [Vibrio parahaemolyticus]|nr:replication protein RepA [Vibrio parahaemolyticus]MDG3393005.1 replication protein RepA [Vibrio parahaemolyticus]MDG3403440.1 replication protein RepA [Vibrio parahaemolyticus]
MSIEDFMDLKFPVSNMEKNIPVVRRKTEIRQSPSYINAIIKIQECSAQEANELGFIARLLVQATMPHSKPKSNEWSRRNGNFTLHMMAPSSVGLPYGRYARLLLVWVTTKAIRNKARMDKGYITEKEARRLDLGPSQRGLMSDLGIRSSGGENGSTDPFRDQIRRLFKTTISVIFTEIQEEAGYIFEVDAGARVAETSCIWWSTKQTEQDLLQGSYIELSPKFFQLITDRPVPIDLRVFRLIKKSKMALDIYCWATYRVSYLKRPTVIPWLSLMDQMGANYASVEGFTKRFDNGLKIVQQIWPALDASPTKKGLLLNPSHPHVPRKKDRSNEVWD